MGGKISPMRGLGPAPVHGEVQEGVAVPPILPAGGN